MLFRSPITVLVVIVAVGAWWLLGAKNTFEGPIRQVATDDTGRVIEGGEPDAPPDPPAGPGGTPGPRGT